MTSDREHAVPTPIGRHRYHVRARQRRSRPSSTRSNGRSSASARSWSSSSPRCSPVGTCCSMTFRVSPRRWPPGRSPRPRACSFSQDPVHARRAAERHHRRDVIDLSTGHPTFRRGPVFAELVLADEINRAPAKTQAALLEAMQESQVTIDGITHPLPSRSSSSRRRTRWSQRAPTRCRRPSSTGSSCAPTSDTRPSPTRSRWSPGGSRRHRRGRDPTSHTRPSSTPCGSPSNRCTSSRCSSPMSSTSSTPAVSTASSRWAPAHAAAWP